MFVVTPRKVGLLQAANKAPARAILLGLLSDPFFVGTGTYGKKRQHGTRLEGGLHIFSFTARLWTLSTLRAQQ